jgi:subtilisin family serine protease
VLAELSHEPRVKIAQPLGTFQTMSTQTPAAAQGYNDPYVSLQRGFEQIHVAEAHRWSRGEGVRVAIIDTGVDVSHPELKNRVVITRNFVDADAAQFRRDRHGTEVAGVIAALANNQLGIVGVAPAVKLIALKACWQLDAGADGARCNSFTLAKALSAAMDEGAQVVNLSFAGPTDPLLASLVESGVQRGVVFVGSVSPPPQSQLSGFPGGASGVLAVDSSEAHAAKNGVLLAPGNEILTLMPEGHYDFASGSSLATAHVTGTVALLLAQNPKLRPESVQSLLSRTSTRTALRDGTVESINACAAMSSLKNAGGCEQPPRVADRPAKDSAGSVTRWAR